MFLTIIDNKDDKLFSENDFSDFKDFELLNEVENKDFTGATYKKVRKETTHLVVGIIDRIDKQFLDTYPNLEYIGIASTGWWDTYFDVEELKRRGIVVTNNPTYSSDSVAEAVFTTLLSHYRRLPELQMGSIQIKTPSGRELQGKTFGVVGLGAIGSQVVTIARGFGMRVVSTSQKVQEEAESVSVETLMKESDIISIHIPKSAEQVNFQFSDVKKDLTIVNASGIEVIDIRSLKEFLRNNIQSAYIDISYPLQNTVDELSSLRNAFLYPLFSNNTLESKQKRNHAVIDNLIGYIKGEVKNRVI